MTPEQAAIVIGNVCSQWEGTIANGDTIKEAYQTLIAAAGVDALAAAAAAAESPAEPDKPTPPNRAARRAKGPTKKAVRK